MNKENLKIEKSIKIKNQVNKDRKNIKRIKYKKGRENKKEMKILIKRR